MTLFEFKEKLDKLYRKVDKVEENLERSNKRYKAERKRRSKLSKQKQEVEKENSKLKNKIQSLKDEDNAIKHEKSFETREITFERCHSFLKKIKQIKSDKKDLVTIYSENKVAKHPKVKDIKNSISKNNFNRLNNVSNSISFFDNSLINFTITCRPFFDNTLVVDKKFAAERILQFINKNKTWVLVSSGESEIYKEKGGSWEKENIVKSRVDRKHSKGGFSQGRFENKRDKQIDEHVKKLNKELQEKEEIYLLGDKRVCKQVEGVYLGGFDKSQGLGANTFYNFHRLE